MLPVILAAFLLASQLAAQRSHQNNLCSGDCVKRHLVGLNLADWSLFAFGAVDWSESAIDACDARNLDFAECATRGTDGGPGIGAGNGMGGGKGKP